MTKYSALQDFDAAVNAIKRWHAEGKLSDSHLIFLADVLRSVNWSEDCHDHLKAAAQIFRSETGLDGRQGKLQAPSPSQGYLDPTEGWVNSGWPD